MIYAYTQDFTQSRTASGGADTASSQSHCKIGMQISSVVLVGLILFVAGCLIYTITRQAWSQTFLLVLIEAAVMGITIGTGIIESLVDAALLGTAGI